MMSWKSKSVGLINLAKHEKSFKIRGRPFKPLLIFEILAGIIFTMEFCRSTFCYFSLPISNEDF